MSQKIIDTNFFKVTDEGGSVKATLSSVPMPRLFEAAVLLLSSPRAQEIKHQALPVEIHQKVLDQEAEFSNSIMDSVRALAGKFGPKDAHPQEFIKKGEQIGRGDAKLFRSDDRKWSLTSNGSPTFHGSMELLCEMMALVNRDPAMLDSNLPDLYRPWLTVRSPADWVGKALKPGVSRELPRADIDPVFPDALRIAAAFTKVMLECQDASVLVDYRNMKPHLDRILATIKGRGVAASPEPAPVVIMQSAPAPAPTPTPPAVPQAPAITLPQIREMMASLKKREAALAQREEDLEKKLGIDAKLKGQEADIRIKAAVEAEKAALRA